MITYSETPQGTDLWLSERAGLLTASNFKTAIGKPGTTRQKLMDTLAFQRRTGIVEASYSNAAMARGNELEPEARDYASLVLGIDFHEVGLCTNSELPGCGASLDGLHETIGLEIKSPLCATHNRYLRENRLPPEYAPQVYGQQLICGLSGTWFCSYYPGDEALLIWVERDEKQIEKLKAGLDSFLADLDAIS